MFSTKRLQGKVFRVLESVEAEIAWNLQSTLMLVVLTASHQVDRDTGQRIASEKIMLILTSLPANRNCDKGVQFLYR